MDHQWAGSQSIDDIGTNTAATNLLQAVPHSESVAITVPESQLNSQTYMSELSDRKPTEPTPNIIDPPIGTSSVSPQEAPSSESDVAIEQITNSLVIAFLIALVVKAITYLLQSSTKVTETGPEL